MSSAPVRRLFLPWQRPLLPQAVALLAGNWSGRGPLDLSTQWVVVPTAQAGRRLREALAAHAGRWHQAVFAPRVITPEVLITAPEGAQVATRLEATLAWVEVLLELELGEFREVFPVDPPAKNFTWALRLTQQLLKLQVALAEGGLQMVDVANRAGKFTESARWRRLGELEALYSAKLRAGGLISASAANIAAAQAPHLPPGMEKVLVLATPDPLPLAIQALGEIAQKIPVEVAVFADEAEAENFDAWGRPELDSWLRRSLSLPEFEAQVHLCADPVAQAEEIARVAVGYGEPEGLLAVGSVDGEVLPPLESALRAKKLAAFNPEGRAQRQGGFYQLLSALAGLAENPSFDAVATLARCPDFCAFLQHRLGDGFSSAHWLEGLDDLRERHLPATLDAAHHHAARGTRYRLLASALELVAAVRTELVHGSFADSAAKTLTMIFDGRTLRPGREGDEELQEAIAAWMETVRACAEAAEKFRGLRRMDWWELALKAFGEARQGTEKSVGAIELQGWLELPWEDAPHLMVAGFNDGRVPDAVVGDAFLPESLRELLGLKTNAQRLVRDAYMLHALAESRRERGRLDLLLGKRSAAGDPLKPSRLLLRCADEELPARVSYLFREPEISGQSVPWTRAWKLAPRRVESPTRVSVTALRGWLKCPLRFYLRYVLGMEAIDPIKSEMDARDFGTLCHAALEAMGRDPAMRDSRDEGALREFLLAEFERAVRRQFGAELSLPLVVQVESARQRLAKAATVQAAERAAGWVITEVERKFELPVGDLVVAGKIDRVERNELTGAVRVIDYKTSDTAVTPEAAHWRNLPSGEVMPEWATLAVGKKMRAWTDLQLPIYLEVLAAEFGPGVVCGYFNLPKASTETGLAMWTEYPPEVRLSAQQCVAGVCAAIRAGEFWPPRELKGWDAELDDFAELFHHGAAESLAWSEVTS